MSAPAPRDIPLAAPALPSMSDQVASLDAAAHDPEGYAMLWLDAVATIGSASAETTLSGREVIWIGQPEDDLHDDRRQRLDRLREHMDSSGNRAAVFRLLITRGLYIDNRAHDPAYAKEAIRAFLAAGGRLLLDPDANLMPGTSLISILGTAVTPEDRAARLTALRDFMALRRRWRSLPFVHRAIKRLGRSTPHGWHIFEGKDA